MTLTNYDYLAVMLSKVTKFDRSALKHTSDLSNKREPKRLRELAAEEAAANIKNISLSNLDTDTLHVLFKILSRLNNLTDEVLQKFVDESDCVFNDVERYSIRYNTRVTHAGIKNLTKLMPNLIYLDMSASNFTSQIETYQHLFSQTKLQEIKANAYITTEGGRTQLWNLAAECHWKITDEFVVFTKQPLSQCGGNQPNICDQDLVVPGSLPRLKLSFV